MKALDWADLLHHHPIFSALEDKEVQWLLQDEVSKERNYPAGTVIIHAGEVGDSIFLVGSGSTEAALPLDGDKRLTLSVMRKGEIFGEMAFFEGRPRSATVAAREACVLLEIGGREFRTLLEHHPDIEVKALLKVSERLRNANEQILSLRVRGVDDKLQLLNDKLDVEHRIVDASLRAAQTVFDQTKLRADEVIQSAERSRMRLQVAASVIGGVLTIAMTFLGFLGIRELDNVRAMTKQVREDAKSVQTELASVREMTIDVQKTRQQLSGTMELMNNLLRSRLRDALGSASVEDAIGIYKQLRALRPDDVSLAEALFSDVEIEILRPASGKRHDWSELLNVMRDDSRSAGESWSEVWLHSLLLANSLLVRPDQFSATLAEFKRVMVARKDRGMGPDRDMLQRLRRFFAQTDAEKGQAFEQAASLVSPL